MVRVGATPLKTKERLNDFMCFAPRPLLSQKTTYVCNVLLCLLLLHFSLYHGVNDVSKTDHELFDVGVCFRRA